MRPISDVATDLGLTQDQIYCYGDEMAKLKLSALPEPKTSGLGKIILVSAINPTRSGEGKTTVSIGLAQGMRRLKQSVALALREPSLGPIFGMKGGGTGGGACRLEPSTRINMHFTGDIHAVGAAHNLLAALVDNEVHFNGGLDLEHRQIFWRRVLDVNDRALRNTVIGLGGRINGVPREASFDITAASEVMAILALADDIEDLKQRLGRILLGFDRKGAPVTADKLQATGAMAALLADAVLPNLVQSSEGVPAWVHGGPFGNIAHGCSSVLATRTAASYTDYVVTEAGFGFDLGAEKFFDIKCRSSGLWPHAVVLVVTVRALCIHGGGVASGEGIDVTLGRGLEHLDHHVESVRNFGFEPIIAINCFSDDTEEALRTIESGCQAWGLKVARFEGYVKGGAGAEALAHLAIQAANQPQPPATYLYPTEQSVPDKIEAVAKRVYGASDVAFSRSAKKQLAQIESLGYDNLPICIAKTHLSLSDDPGLVGHPRGFRLQIDSLRIAAGAGYVLALSGDIVTMPGLPREPAARLVNLKTNGEIDGI